MKKGIGAESEIANHFQCNYT